MVDSPRLVSFREAVERRLEEILPAATELPTELHEAMRYSALAPGKRLRPLLAMAAAEAVGGKPNDALDAGCAAELIHCFSLIHDDLPSIDNDDLRRGRPTAHIQFGEAMAILAGDALFALAFEVVAGCSDQAALITPCVRSLSKATGSTGLVGGEVLDILAEGKEPKMEMLQLIHRQKTGSLISAACEMGAILGGGSPGERENLATFGMHIGLAFQIADDILNETGTPEELGKAVGSDRDRNKLTYPTLMGIEESRIAAENEHNLALSYLGNLKGDTGSIRELAGFAVTRTF